MEVVNEAPPALLCFGDQQFTRELAKYLNSRNITQICEHFNKPITNANVNPRTGRIRIGMASTRPRKILRDGSTKNYKSIILKFCRFKMKNYGVDSLITTEMIEKYVDQHLNNGTKSYQTMSTEIRVLNKNIIIPTTGQEMPRPKLKSSVLGKNCDKWNNKPQFTHEEIALSMLRMYNSCLNRDHVHKAFLIYYTGLRSAEADALTFRDIAEGYSKDLIIIPVRHGKGRQMRNVILFHGAPRRYYKYYLLPYLASKMETLLMDNIGKSTLDFLDTKLFTKSKYAACRKAYRKCLWWAIRKISLSKNSTADSEEKIEEIEMIEEGEKEEDEEEEEEEEDEDEEEEEESIRGAGLHSLRADWATRTLKLLYCVTKHPFIASNMTSRLLGHRNGRLVMKHYLSKGQEFNVSKIIDKYKYMDEGGIGGIIIDKQYSSTDKPEKVLFNGYKYGKMAKALMKQKRIRKRGINVSALLKVKDDNFIIPNYNCDTQVIENVNNNNTRENENDVGEGRATEEEEEENNDIIQAFNDMTVPDNENIERFIII